MPDREPDTGAVGEAEAALRQRWRALVGERLPAAARERPEWPVRLDHCFARILLDDACDAPWRERVRAPAWREAPPALLARAIRTGEAVLAGEADLAALNLRSLRLRGTFALGLASRPDRVGADRASPRGVSAPRDGGTRGRDAIPVRPIRPDRHRHPPIAGRASARRARAGTASGTASAAS